MFRVMRGGTVIGNGLKIKGDVSAEGLVEVNGQIEGDVRCTSLVIFSKCSDCWKRDSGEGGCER